MSDWSPEDELEVIDPGPPETAPDGTGSPRPDHETRGRPTRHRVVAALIAVALVVAVVAITRDDAPDAQTPEATLDLASGQGGDSSTATHGDASATLLVAGDDGAFLVDTRNRGSAPVPGIATGPAGIVDDQLGTALVSAGDMGRLFTLFGPNARAVPREEAYAFLAARDDVLAADDMRLVGGDEPLAAAAGRLAVRDENDDLYVVDVDDGSRAPLVEADGVRILDRHGGRLLWTEDDCGRTCEVKVTDISTRTTAAIPSERAVTHGVLSPSGARAALFDGAGWYADIAVNQGESQEWLSLGTSQTVDAAYGPDEEHLYVLTREPTRILAVSGRDADILAFDVDAGVDQIAWLGPSVEGGPTWQSRRLDVEALDGALPPLLLGRESGVVIAYVDEDDKAVTVDFDTGLTATLDDHTGSPLYAFDIMTSDHGWVVLSDRTNWWLPPDASPVDLGPKWPLSPTGHEPLFVTYGPGGVEAVERLGDAGLVGAERRFYLEPLGTLGDLLVFNGPASLLEGPAGVVVLDPSTGEESFVPAPEPGAAVRDLAGDRILWQQPEWSCEPSSCALTVTDKRGQVLANVEDARVGAPAQLSRDGAELAVGRHGDGTHVVVVDVADRSRRELQGEFAVTDLDWSTSGWLLVRTGSELVQDSTLWAVAPGEVKPIEVPGLRIGPSFVAL